MFALYTRCAHILFHSVIYIHCKSHSVCALLRHRPPPPNRKLSSILASRTPILMTPIYYSKQILPLLLLLLMRVIILTIAVCAHLLLVAVFCNFVLSDNMHAVLFGVFKTATCIPCGSKKSSSSTVLSQILVF